MDRRCAKCGEPLARKNRESTRYWEARQYCGRSCYVGDRNSNPIWFSFAEKTERTKGGCIVWTAHKDKKGYGRLATSGGEVLAHRIAYAMHFGAFPRNLHVLHRCDNPSCVNPHHLFLGTNQDNMADKVRKGRTSRRFGNANPNWRHGRNCRKIEIEQATREQGQANNLPALGDA